MFTHRGSFVNESSSLSKVGDREEIFINRALYHSISLYSIFVRIANLYVYLSSLVIVIEFLTVHLSSIILCKNFFEDGLPKKKMHTLPYALSSLISIFSFNMVWGMLSTNVGWIKSSDSSDLCLRSDIQFSTDMLINAYLLMPPVHSVSGRCSSKLSNNFLVLVLSSHSYQMLDPHFSVSLSPLIPTSPQNRTTPNLPVTLPRYPSSPQSRESRDQSRTDEQWRSVRESHRLEIVGRSSLRWSIRPLTTQFSATDGS